MAANLEINIGGDANNVLGVIIENINVVGNSLDEVNKSSSGFLGSLTSSFDYVKLDSLTNTIRNLSSSLNSLTVPGMQFETALTDLSGATGVVGDKLDTVGKIARKNARIFGGDATKSVEGLKEILQQFGSELADQPELLQEFSDHAETLAKITGTDVKDSVESLSKVMKQYHVDLKNPIQAQKDMDRILNAMAASVDNGTMNFGQLEEAMNRTRGSAYNSGVAVEEMFSVIQQLDGATTGASDAGRAFRQVAQRLSGEEWISDDQRAALENAGISIEDLTDTSTSLSDRLRLLSPVMEDTALLGDMFSDKFISATQHLIQNADAIDEVTRATTDTNSAQEGLALQMDTTAEKMNRIGAFFDHLKIKIFDLTGSFIPYLEITSNAFEWFSGIAPGIDLLQKLAKSQKVLNAVTKIGNALRLKEIWSFTKTNVLKGLSSVKNALLTASQWLLNIAMNANPIGLIVLGITALIGVVTTIIAKWDEWGAMLTIFLGPLGLVVGAVKSVYDHWQSIKDAFTDGGIIGGLKRIGVVLLDTLLKPVQQLLGMIGKIIPGVSSGADYIQELRENLDLVTDGEKKTTEEIAEITIGIEDDDLIASIDDLADLYEDSSLDGRKTGGTNFLSTVLGDDKDKGSTKSGSGTGTTSGFASAEKKVIDVKIESLVKNFTITTSDMSQSASQLQEMIAKALTGAVRDFEISVG